jgi:ATP-dependent 26S proteasome regulatory subunit
MMLSSPVSSDLFSRFQKNTGNSKQSSLASNQETPRMVNSNERMNSKRLVTTSDIIQSLSSLISTITLCYLSFRISNELQNLIRHVASTLGAPSANDSSVKKSIRIQEYLKPNATLNFYELEMLSSVVFPNDITTDLKDLGGLKEIKQNLLDCVSAEDLSRFNMSLASKPAKGVLLFGPPGCGKTSLVQGLCKRLHQPMLCITPSALHRKYVGETSQLIRATFSLASKLEPCIIFVDEMDSLFRARRETEQEFDRNVKTEFMQL